MVIDKLLQKPIEDWNWRIDTACAAFLLSRSDSASKLLNRNQVDILGRRVLIEIQENIGSTYSRFSYAPFLLVGLLRQRLKEPRALVSSADPLAKKLSASVDRALCDLRTRLRGQPQFNRYVPILEATQAELQSEGTNPDLLLDIYSGA